MPYIGRFAPSPTGPLHKGSLVAAVASYLDAQVHGGQWLLRIDNADLSRVQAGSDRTIIEQLLHYGFVWNGAVQYTQDFRPNHAAALATLTARGSVYGCRCSRAMISQSARSSTAQEQLYAGSCRAMDWALDDPLLRSMRLNVSGACPCFKDRWGGAHAPVRSDVLSDTVGDFVLWRPASVSGFDGGAYAYQLTMPVDDAASGVTHVVRGADLLSVTARQIYLYELLGLQRPLYMHVPVLLMDNGIKYSKQHGAPALPMLKGNDPTQYLNQALQDLGLIANQARNLDEFWTLGCHAWAKQLNDWAIT